MCRCARAGRHTHTHAQMKTEQSPMLLMGILARGRSNDNADVFSRGCSR